MSKFKNEAKKRYRAHARLKKKGYVVKAKERTVYSITFDSEDKDLKYLLEHGYNLQHNLC